MATATLLGGSGEEIAYEGPSSGTITLNSSGTASIEVIVGSYTFTGGLSGYAASADIAEDCTVFVRPMYVLYWYGATQSSFGGGFSSSLFGQQYCNNTLTLNAASMQLLLKAGGQNQYGYFYTDSAVPLSGKTKLRVKGSVASAASGATYLQARASASQSSAQITSADYIGNPPNDTRVTIPSTGTGQAINMTIEYENSNSAYVGIGGYTSSWEATSKINIDAVWLE